jgi:hypothetical protein
MSSCRDISRISSTTVRCATLLAEECQRTGTEYGVSAIHQPFLSEDEDDLRELSRALPFRSQESTYIDNWKYQGFLHFLRELQAVLGPADRAWGAEQIDGSIELQLNLGKKSIMSLVISSKCYRHSGGYFMTPSSAVRVYHPVDKCDVGGRGSIPRRCL